MNDNNVTLPSIPEALKFRKEQMMWTQKELGIRLGLSESYISEVLNGNRNLPIKATVKAYHLGIPAKVLLQETI